MVMIILHLDLQLPVQPVPITIKVVTLNPSHGDLLYSSYFFI
jgi:hypothetical protein